MIKQLPAPIAKAAPIAIPLAIIALARIATFSSAATAYPALAPRPTRSMITSMTLLG